MILFLSFPRRDELFFLAFITRVTIADLEAHLLAPVLVAADAERVGFRVELMIYFLGARRRTAVVLAPEVFRRRQSDLIAADRVSAALLVKPRGRAIVHRRLHQARVLERAVRVENVFVSAASARRVGFRSVRRRVTP